MSSLTVHSLVKDHESSSWGKGSVESREESLQPQTVGWHSGMAAKPSGDPAGWARKEDRTPAQRRWSEHYYTWKTASCKGRRPPRVIADTVDTSSTGSNTNSKPPWMVALIFCSVFCFGQGGGLSFIPEMEASYRQN